MAAFIYIVGRASDIAGCKFKIGLTTDFFNRLHNYATSAPPDDQFTIYKTYQITPPDRLKDIEDYIHASLNSYNMAPHKRQHEWFKIPTDILQSKLDEFIIWTRDVLGVQMVECSPQKIIAKYRDYHKDKAYGIYDYHRKQQEDAVSQQLDSKTITRERERIQTEYITSAITEIETNTRCIIKAPTGLGKTVINFKLIAHFNFNLTIFFTPRKILNQQTFDAKYTSLVGQTKFEQFVYDPSSNNWKQLLEFIAKSGNKIVSACYQSCSNLVPKLLDADIKPDIVICDEAHRIGSWGFEPYQRQLFLNMTDKIIFTTATPTQNMLAHPELFGNVIEHCQIYELITKGILCDFETIIKHIDHQKDSVDIPYFVRKCMRKYGKRKGIIYVNTQINARRLFHYMRTKYPTYNTYIYISDKLTVSSFEGDIGFTSRMTDICEFEQCIDPAIIITCDKISYGYDNIDIDLVCFADPRQSETDIRQIVGRGLRADSSKYPNKVLHILLPITVNLEEEDASNYDKIKEFLRFVINECGKDIINGHIISTRQDAEGTFSIAERPDYKGDRIPEQICDELSTTLYSQYAKFIKFLKINNVSDVASYLQTREKYSWMPSIETLQIKYPKFGFVVLGHPNNASYYQTKTEYENAYQKALKNIDCDDYMPDKLIKQVLAYDSKLHPLKDLFYPKV